jgi:hypothetical protein
MGHCGNIYALSKMHITIKYTNKPVTFTIGANLIREIFT